MFKRLLVRIKQHGLAGLRRFQQWLKAKTKPTTTSLGAARNLVRSKTELVMENALLRQQLIVLNRSIKRPHVKRADR